jgi:hypothetical protein
VKPSRVVAVLGVAAALAVAGTIAAVSLAQDAGLDGGGAAPADAAPDPIEQAVAAGRYWRLETVDGPVHVWVPAGYHADGAATVIYAHGYYTEIDEAWIEHRLPQQFALSGVNALFIAPEAPKGSRHKVSWPALGELLVEVQRATGVARPMGVIAAIGHSGAYRVLLQWMEYPPLDVIIAMDAMYGEVDAWSEWLAASPQHRLINVGDDTVRWTEELQLALDPGDLVILDRFPDRGDSVGEQTALADARAARVVYIRSQLGHMPLVTAGLGLPFVLRLLPAEILPDAPWQQPLGLPPIDAGAPDSVTR